ncbi:MAG: histidinol-phosphatase HisJ family protein [Thermoleophilia bacterium]|jgi:histidinol-phosphatase (PHP family)
MPLPDYHTHTERCGHASGRPFEYVQAARAAGLLAIGVADHFPLLPSPNPELTMDIDDLGDYIAEVESLKEAHPGFVLLGVEADYRPETVTELAALLAEYPFDYVIGSVHFLGEWAFDDPQQIERYAGRDIDRSWAEYLQLVGDAADSGLFTILGHLDLMKKFGHRPTRSLDRELERLVERVAHAGVLVEINTAGLHKPVNEIYPAPHLLRLLHEAGVAITFGSDAHRPTEVGRDFAQAAALARLAGYDTYAMLDPQAGGNRAAIRLRAFEDIA